MDALVTFGEVTVSPFELLPALQAVPCYFYTTNLMHSHVEVQGGNPEKIGGARLAQGNWQAAPRRSSWSRRAPRNRLWAMLPGIIASSKGRS
jgi:hypothetical protein